LEQLMAPLFFLRFWFGVLGGSWEVVLVQAGLKEGFEYELM